MQEESTIIPNKLYVTNIPYESTDQDLAGYFSRYGNVVKATVIKDRDTKASRGFGFVEMSSEIQAKAAFAADGEDFMGRPLKIAYAQPSIKKNQR